MNLLRRAALVFIAFAAQASAQSLVHPGGIAVDSDPSIDITYQVIPGYDPVEKVLAGWLGDQLQYFVSVEKLPPGWTDHDKYFEALIRDLRLAGRSIETARSGQYQSESALIGHYVEILSKGSEPSKQATQDFHFIANGDVAFVAIATLTDNSSADRMLEETKLLLQSASLAEGGLPQEVISAETPYVGSWESNAKAPNGSNSTTTMILNNDLSFSIKRITQGDPVFNAVGVWSLSGERIRWTYLRSEPPLPSNEREAIDEVLSFDADRLVLRSERSGGESEFIRQ